ncbi:trimeric intracellular cation channel family protein [Nakamurella deserti]|uniref:trimeric intracellular cation channel family protein n=1 Tax=Nakamurella deserti TaxID=2164074 RepID=UPI000DBEA75C|nr:trimeric intracellular cation channel family protein [Nakamurella deserti]
MLSTHGVETALNLVGILAFALSGALLGVRRQFDIVGMAVLATVTAIGGGIIRDVMIGAVPPAALNNPSWLVLPLVATLLTFRWHPQVRRMHRAVELFDAVGLGVFCATATVKAIEYGVHPLASVLLGCITGVGGGLIRDVLAGVTPAVLRKDSRLYVVPAVVGCAIVAVASAFGPVDIGVQAAGALVIVLLRGLALWRGWTAPVPRMFDSQGE